MQPHELIAGLVTQTGLSLLEVATQMDKPSFQGTLHKFVNGNVSSPSRATAEKIAKYFQIPTEAVYSEKLATDVAAEKGVRALPGGRRVIHEMQVRETQKPYGMHRRLPAALQSRIDRLSDDQFKGLETVIKGYLDAVAPNKANEKTA